MVATEPVLGTPYRVNASDPPDLGAATLDIAQALAPRGVGYVADTTARDSKYNALIAAGAEGMACYVDSRKCLSFYSDGAWQWLATPRLMFTQSNNGFQNGGVVNETTPGQPGVALILAAPTTLPGGQRLLHVTVHADLQGSTGGSPGTGGTNIIVTGPSVPGNYQANIPTTGPDGQQSVGGCFYAKVTGSFQYQMFLLHRTGVGKVDAYETFLQVVDCGPAD